MVAISIFFFTCAAVAVDSRELDKCSQTLAKSEQSLGALDQKQIDELLSSVNNTCLSSVEFSEWSNELVYAVATAMPLDFINSFGRLSHEIQDNILGAIESPVNDGIDLRKAYRALSTVPASKEKSRVLAAIEIAAGKIGLDL